jgi:hypothetical protein
VKTVRNKTVGVRIDDATHNEALIAASKLRAAGVLKNQSFSSFVEFAIHFTLRSTAKILPKEHLQAARKAFKSY